MENKESEINETIKSMILELIKNGAHKDPDIAQVIYANLRYLLLTGEEKKIINGLNLGVAPSVYLYEE